MYTQLPRLTFYRNAKRTLLQCPVRCPVYVCVRKAHVCVCKAPDYKANRVMSRLPDLYIAWSDLMLQLSVMSYVSTEYISGSP